MVNAQQNHTKYASDSIQMKIIIIFFVAETMAFIVYGPIAYGPMADSPLIKLFCGEWTFDHSEG